MRTTKLSVLLVLLALVAAACGGGGEAAPEGGGDATGATDEETAAAEEEIVAPRVAFTAPTIPSIVERIHGPVELGDQFRLEMTEEDFTTFEDHATATQSTLGGQHDVVGGSFASLMLVRESGQDFQAFCPFINLDDFVLAGRNGVTEMEQLFDPQYSVAIDSFGGAADLILNAMLQANGFEQTGEDIPGAQIVTSSGLRTTALAAGEVDASFIHLTQFNQVQQQADDAVIISALYEDVPTFIKEVYQAPAQWLEENPESAAAFCASVIASARQLSDDYDAFAAAVETYVEEPPEEAELQELHRLINEYDFWPIDSGFDEEAVQFMGEVAVASGIVEQEPDPDDLVNREVLERAFELADEVDS